MYMYRRISHVYACSEYCTSVRKCVSVRCLRPGPCVNVHGGSTETSFMSNENLKNSKESTNETAVTSTDFIVPSIYPGYVRADHIRMRIRRLIWWRLI